MRVMRRFEGKWLTETPADLSVWLWANDGGEAVVIDGNVYYCATPGQVQLYKGKWESEKKANDPRRAAMFLDLDKKLFHKEPPTSPLSSAAWCEGEGKLCSEVANCSGPCASS